MRPRAFAVFLLLMVAAFGLNASIKPDLPDAATLQLVMKRLTVVGGALYIAAHPDDENTAALSYLAMGKLVRSAYLAINRGEGGQNLIGPEQGDLLGLIRTQELLAARSIDHANQFFTRAIDFGFSKTPEESLRFWGKDKVLSDVVWVIRRFRPDVIILRFPTSGGGHGHHTASAILGREAFDAAADPNRFPEQLKFVKPWQAKRIVWNRYSWGGQQISESDKASSPRMEIGEYSALLGKSFTELAGVSRSMHKSQGFGDSEDRGQATNYFQLLAGEPASPDLFDGIDLTWKRIPGGEPIGQLLSKTYDSFDPQNPSSSVPGLIKAYSMMRALPENPAVQDKIEEAKQAIQACAGLWLEAIASQPSVAPGDSIKITSTAINRSQIDLKLSNVVIMTSDKKLSEPGLQVERSLGYNVPVSQESNVRISENSPYSQPYWLQGRDGMALAMVQDQKLIGLPESPSPVTAKLTLKFANESVEFIVPVLHRWVDPVQGERYSRLEIVPEVAINLREPVSIFTNSEKKDVSLILQSGKDQAAGELHLKLPAGWKSDPAAIQFNFQRKGDTQNVVFHVMPGSGAQSGSYKAEAVMGTKTISAGISEVDYPHIPRQMIFPPAEGKLVRVDAKRTIEHIGYIVGSGDQIPGILRQLGIRVTLLSDEDLSGRDLSGFDAIVAGIRAYNTRNILRSVQNRLMEYVEQGGTYVVQYNTTQDMVLEQSGPYPFTISRDRVSVEDVPVWILNPSHSLLSSPNKIGSDDFNGWVQERGLYFPSQWDPKYEPVLGSADPGEPQRPGGLLFTRHGKGIYIYTGYSWFRQLPAGVPGAIRLFLNMISAQ